MSDHATRGYLLDTTALAALGSSMRVSVLLTTAPHFHLPIYAPVTCVDAADQIRPASPDTSAGSPLWNRST